MNNSESRQSVLELDSIEHPALTPVDRAPLQGALSSNDIHQSHDEALKQAQSPLHLKEDLTGDNRAHELTSCPVTHHVVTDSSNSSEDEFVSSGDDYLDPLPLDEQHHPLFASSSIAEHTAYFEKSLNETLDSLKLDDSLVLQAQLSGQLNQKSTELHEKKLQMISKVQSLKALYKYHITEDRIGKLESDIKSINTRVGILMSGVSRKGVFGKSKKLGVCDKYPVEFNKAKDKVLERVPEP